MSDAFKKKPTPNYVGQVKYMEFKDLKEAVDIKNEDYLKKVIKNMYVKKEAYILRNAATQKLKETINAALVDINLDDQNEDYRQILIEFNDVDTKHKVLKK